MPAPTKPTDIVRRFRRLRALVLGDAMLDTYLEGTASRLCGEGPVPVVRKTAERHAPGGAANAAANLCALGAAVTLLGYRGADAAGERLVSALEEQGVAADGLVCEAEVSTIHKVRILADGQYVVRFDEGESDQHIPASERRLLDLLDDAYARCDVVLVSDYGYGAVSDAMLARLRALRERESRPLVVDSKQLHRFRACRATVVTPNHLEARLLVERGSRGAEPPPGDTEALPRAMEPIGRRLLTLLDAEHAAITLAGAGALLLNRQGRALHLPAHPVAQAHDVGAGDTFAAALALALGAGADPAAAARLGIEAAGIAVARPWTTVVRHHELLQRVSLRDATSATVSSRHTVARLAARLAGERAAGRTIVFTNGVFDILHAGHVQFLRQARALGDLLVVGVNSDRGARRLKGKGRPINGERDRLALVAALDAVDEAVLFDEATPADLIRALRPHLHVKGGDYAHEPLPEAEAVREVGGQVVILPLAGAHSTSAVIERIITRAAPQQRASESEAAR